MTWKDRASRVKINGRQLIGGSFRGVPFFVGNTSTKGGRRVEVSEFPQGEKHQVEDLGRRAQQFSLSGYVVGASYDAAKFALQEALDQGGPGKLVLPNGRNLQAYCEEYEVSESRDEGGFASFSMSFHAAGKEGNGPTVRPDTKGRLKAAVANANAATRAAAALSTIGKLSNNLIGPIEDAVDKTTSNTLDTFGPLTDTPQDLAAMRLRLDIIGAKVSSLARAPERLFDAYKDALAFAFRAPDFATLKRSRKAQAEVEDAAPSSPFPTVGRTAQAAAFDAVNVTLRRASLIKKVEAAGGGDYEFFDDATGARGELLEEIAGELEDADLDVLTAFAGLRAALIEALPGEADLKTIADYTPILSAPSVVVSHELYKTADRSDEIEERNKIPHPLFLIGGDVLQVVSDE